MSDPSEKPAPAVVLSLVVACGLIVAGVAVSFTRGNPGPLLILGGAAWVVLKFR